MKLNLTQVSALLIGGGRYYRGGGGSGSYDDGGYDGDGGGGGVVATMVEEVAVIAVEVAETPEVEVATKLFSAPKCNSVYNKNTSKPHQNMP